MPRLKDVTKQERRQRIATAALRCFALSGIHGTSMADIIRESGLSSGSIYSHFDNKADLVRFAMTNMLEDRFALLGSTDRSTPVAGYATPHSLLAQLLDGPAANRGQTNVLVQVWGEMAKDAELAAVAEESIGLLRRLLSRSLLDWAADAATSDRHPARTAEVAAEWLVTLLFGYATRLALQPAVDPGALRSKLLSTARVLDAQP